MRKLMSLMLAACVAIAISGCGSGNEAEFPDEVQEKPKDGPMGADAAGGPGGDQKTQDPDSTAEQLDDLP